MLIITKLKARIALRLAPWLIWLALWRERLAYLWLLVQHAKDLDALRLSPPVLTALLDQLGGNQHELADRVTAIHVEVDRLHVKMREYGDFLQQCIQLAEADAARAMQHPSDPPVPDLFPQVTLVLMDRHERGIRSVITMNAHDRPRIVTRPHGKQYIAARIDQEGRWIYREQA